MPEEIRLFIRSCLFAVVVSIAYWFISYDYIGTVLLGGFAVASFTLFSMLRRGQPGRGARPAGSRGEQGVAPGAGGGAVGRIRELVDTSERPGEERPFEDEAGRIPGASLAPLLIGVGVAMMALGLIFGLWSVVAGAIPLLLGFREWLREVSAELQALTDDDEAAAAREAR